MGKRAKVRRWNRRRVRQRDAIVRQAYVRHRRHVALAGKGGLCVRGCSDVSCQRWHIL
jgi:hypothetical protein